jgi:hypothetical protein
VRKHVDLPFGLPDLSPTGHPTHWRGHAPDLVVAWLIVSIVCSALGWGLSAVGQLTTTGYALAVPIAVIVWIGWQSRRAPDFDTRMRAARELFAHMAKRAWRRCRPRRALPRIYFALAILACVGAIVHAPNNYDALTYRIPRVLHWWAEGHWLWIATPNGRMNYSATGFEWLMAPLLVLTRSERLTPAINLVAYLLLPGLVFSAFRQAGVARRVAWAWMWILPTAFCFVMQAGGVGNDAYAAVYVLASVLYAGRARTSGQIHFLWLASLAAALATGAKTSNLPLLLPCLIAALPAWRVLRTRVVGTLVVACVAVLVSVVPTTVLNYRYTGDWSGDPTSDLRLRNPLIGVVGNALELSAQNLLPPVFPFARQVQNEVEVGIPGPLKTALSRDFPRFRIDLGELPQEESTGLGVGVTLLAILAGGAPLLFRGGNRPRAGSPQGYRRGLAIGAGAWVACLVFMSTLGSEAPARLAAPYYPLLILALVVLPANDRLVRQRWWAKLAGLTAASAVIGLILTPSRPLWPVQLLTERVSSAAGANSQISRVAEVYAVYAQRADLLGPLRQFIPQDVRVVGLIDGENDSELALWRPLGKRRVVDLVDGAIGDEVESAPVWVVVKEAALAQRGLGSLDAWLQQSGGHLVARAAITSTVLEGPQYWAVVQRGTLRGP